MKKFVLFFCLFLNGLLCLAQEKDILSDEFRELKKTAFDKRVDLVTAEILIRNYLKKVLRSDRKELIGRAYYVLSYKYGDVENSLKYIDSSIFYTKNIKGDTIFPMKAYFYKGVFLSRANDFTGALDKYILAESLAKASGSIEYQHHIKFNIGLLKRRLGDYEEAIKLFKECQVYEKGREDVNVLRYQNILFQLSSIYYESGQIAKCSEINLQGIQLEVKDKKLDLHNNFIVNEGINLHIKGHYKSSIDSIEKGVNHLLRESHKVIAYFYLAKSYDGLKNKEKALYFFKEIDTFFSETKELFPTLRTSYEYLIKNAKKDKDKEQQLYYTEQLLKVDSTIHADYKYLSNKIVREYDIPELIDSRNNLIIDLKNQKKQIIIISILCVLFIIGLVIRYYYRLKNKYQKRYEEIVKQSNIIIEEETIVTKNAKLHPVIKDIDVDIVNEVLEQLDLFEKENHYLTNQISLKDVAKMVNTNSKYLSKIINSYKEKNFATYINDLRVDYLIDRMQHDPVYQKYTIRAIAEEGGFSNPEGFLRAFQKKTGLKPSYFIKKIRESKENKQ